MPKIDETVIGFAVYEDATEYIGISEVTLPEISNIIKLSEVVAKMYAYLPSVVRILFTEKQLVQIAESVLAEAKKKWEANENLTTYIENKQQTTPAVVTLVENTK